jgi:hypothetical protein
MSIKDYIEEMDVFTVGLILFVLFVLIVIYLR